VDTTPENREIHPLFLVGSSTENLPANCALQPLKIYRHKKNTGRNAQKISKKDRQQHNPEDVPQQYKFAGTLCCLSGRKKAGSDNAFIFKRRVVYIPKIARQLPREITENFENEKFIRIHDSNDEIMGKYCVPISFMPWGIFFNKNLADKYQLKDLSSTIREKGIDFSLKLARKHLPAEIKVTGNIWNYLVIKGIPGNPEELEMFLHQNFDHICKTFHSPEDIFIFDQHDPLESQRLFLDGKLLFYMTFRPLALIDNAGFTR
jgi:hypothetical protein